MVVDKISIAIQFLQGFWSVGWYLVEVKRFNSFSKKRTERMHMPRYSKTGSSRFTLLETVTERMNLNGLKTVTIHKSWSAALNRNRKLKFPCLVFSVVKVKLSIFETGGIEETNFWIASMTFPESELSTVDKMVDKIISHLRTFNYYYDLIDSV